MAEMLHQSLSILIDTLNYTPQTKALVMDYISNRGRDLNPFILLLSAW